MPIYFFISENGEFIPLAPKVNSSESTSVSYNINGKWENMNSGWVNVNGVWQQIYQKPAYVDNFSKSIVFLGDSITWGNGLPLFQQWSQIIQQHVDGVRTNDGAFGFWSPMSVTGVTRTLMYDDGTDNPFNGGFNGNVKFTASSGVQYINEGPFSGFKGTKNSSYRDPMIQIPENEYISIFLNSINTKYFYIVLGGYQGNSFVPAGTFPSAGTISFYDSNNVNLYEYAFSTTTNTSSPNSIVEPYHSIPTGIPSTSTVTVDHIKIQTTIGNLKIYSISFNYSPYVGSEFSNIQIQVMGRNSYAIEDYLGKSDEIKRSIMYKTFYDDPSNGNAKPTVVISAGINDILTRNKTSAQYQADLTQLATELMTASTDSQLHEIIPSVDVVLTVPLIPTNTGFPQVEPYANYAKAVKNVANNLKLHCVDLSTLNMTSNLYQSDGLHPNQLGAIKIANKYIDDLGLTAMDSTFRELVIPIRGLHT